MKIKNKIRTIGLSFSMRGSVICVAVLAALALGTAGTASANLVLNGGFENTTLTSPGGYFCAAGATCTSNVADWGSVCNVGGCGNGSTVLSVLFPGTNGVAFNCFCGLDGTVTDSPDGGNYVGADGDPTFSAPFFQTINGLTAGQSYTLMFDQAAAQQGGTFGPTTERWQVSLGSQTQLSTLMNNASGGFVPWNEQTMTFTASSSSEVLTFLAVGTPIGAPPVALLDGVSLTATPEPSYVAFTGLALLGLFAVIKRQRQKQA